MSEFEKKRAQRLIESSFLSAEKIGMAFSAGGIKTAESGSQLEIQATERQEDLSETAACAPSAVKSDLLELIREREAFARFQVYREHGDTFKKVGLNREDVTLERVRDILGEKEAWEFFGICNKGYPARVRALFVMNADIKTVEIRLSFCCQIGEESREISKSEVFQAGQVGWADAARSAVAAAKNFFGN